MLTYLAIIGLAGRTLRTAPGAVREPADVPPEERP